MVKVEIKRTGFPVEIGDIELWFDSSVENLKNFANLEKVSREKLDKVSEKAQHVHFPKEINDETVNEITEETIEEAFSLTKEFIAIQYDVIFGDGTFKKIYEKYPDIYALEDTLDIVGLAITERLEKEFDERVSRYHTTKNDLLKKKQAKQK